MYLLFSTNRTKTTKPELGDGSLFALIRCKEGWYASDEFKEFVDGLDWTYTEVDSITPIEPEV